MSPTPPRYTPATFELAARCAPQQPEVYRVIGKDQALETVSFDFPSLFMQAADTESKFQAQARVLDRLRAELTAGDVFTTGIPSMFGERFIKVLDRLLREEGVTPT